MWLQLQDTTMNVTVYFPVSARFSTFYKTWCYIFLQNIDFVLYSIASTFVLFGLTRTMPWGREIALSVSEYRLLAAMDLWQKAERFSFLTTAYVCPFFFFETGQLKWKLLFSAALAFVSFSTLLRSERNKASTHTKS